MPVNPQPVFARMEILAIRFALCGTAIARLNGRAHRFRSAVASIDQEISAGHGTGRVARKKQCLSRELLRQSESPQKMLWSGYPARGLEVVDATRTECPDGVLAAGPILHFGSTAMTSISTRAPTGQTRTSRACNGRGDVPLHDRVDSVEVSRIEQDRRCFTSAQTTCPCRIALIFSSTRTVCSSSVPRSGSLVVRGSDSGLFVIWPVTNTRSPVALWHVPKSRGTFWQSEVS